MKHDLTNTYVPKVFMDRDTIISDIQRLGAGSHANVYSGLYNRVGEKSSKVAIKVYSNKHIAYAEREISILSSNINHPNVVQYLFHKCDQSSIFFTMPLYKTTLSTILYSDMNFPKVQYANQLLSAMQYLHSNQFAHRDIKADNVLLSDNGVVISDFSVACVHHEGRTHSLHAHPLIYRAPEVFGSYYYNAQQSDMWAVGLLLIEFDLRKPVFRDGTEFDVKQQIQNTFFPILNTFQHTNTLYTKLVPYNKRTLSPKVIQNLIYIEPTLRKFN